MQFRNSACLLFLGLVCLVPLHAGAQAASSPATPAPTAKIKPAGQAMKLARASLAPLLAPLPAMSAPVSSHAPFEDGDCKICHQSADPKQPGPVTKKGPALCLECHEEFADVMKRPHKHEPARDDCTYCHNPHNAAFPKLILKETRTQCTSCHVDIKKIANTATVPHKALTDGKQCTNCHNPHASTVEKLLVQLPHDLCMNCHNRDDAVDAKGKKMQNLKTWLANNKVWHTPVSEDCSSCHEPHGSGHFRLLKEEYPPEFYAPYSPQAYALCFSCHGERAFSTAQTSTLTKFRDGTTNLHYLHLQQSGRGRTCRACHEVHASNQQSIIRDSVPFGSGGWKLKINYTKTPDGGSCAKTCHSVKGYSNLPAAKAR